MAKAKKAQQKPEAEEQAPEAQAAQAPESISLNDLQLLLQIVDLASSRGAFRGAELTQVGAIFDKLNAFLSFIAEQQAAAAEEGTEEQE